MTLSSVLTHYLVIISDALDPDCWSSESGRGAAVSLSLIQQRVLCLGDLEIFVIVLPVSTGPLRCLRMCCGGCFAHL